MRTRVLVLAISVTACVPLGFGTPAHAAGGKCRALTDEQVGTLELDSGPDISAGVAVKVPKKGRNNSGWPTHLIAAEISDSAPGAWAVGGMASYSVEGPVDSLNDEALDATDFGAAAQPGSPAVRQRNRLAGLKQYRQVLQCLESGGGEPSEGSSRDEEFRQAMIDRFGPEVIYDDGSKLDYVALAQGFCSQSRRERRTLRNNLGADYEGSMQQFIIENYCGGGGG